MVRSYRSAIVAAIAVLMATAACSRVDGDGAVVGHGVDRFPSESLVEWVSYADHVSYFVVTAERELPWGAHEQQHGEGMVGREVTVQIEDTLWTHASAPAIETEFVYETDGWVLKENEQRPFVLEGGTRVEVGERYLAAWVHTDVDGWFPLASSTIMPVDDAGIPGEPTLGHGLPSTELLVGRSPAAISQLLASTGADPVAARYFHLDPEPRYNAVLLSAMPERPAFVRAVIGNANGTFGYVSADDWAALEGESDALRDIPFYDQDGLRLGTFSLADGQVLEE